MFIFCVFQVSPQRPRAPTPLVVVAATMTWPIASAWVGLEQATGTETCNDVTDPICFHILNFSCSKKSDHSTGTFCYQIVNMSQLEIHGQKVFLMFYEDSER